MQYTRYSMGNFAHSYWIECTDCGTRDKPFYVWEQDSTRHVNFDIPVGAVMQHEIAQHLSHNMKPR